MQSALQLSLLLAKAYRQLWKRDGAKSSAHHTEPYLNQYRGAEPSAGRVQRRAPTRRSDAYSSRWMTPVLLPPPLTRQVGRLKEVIIRGGENISARGFLFLANSTIAS